MEANTEGLAGVLQAADSPWAIVALVLLGSFALLWKFGGELLTLTRENNTVAKEAHSVAKDAKSKADEISSNIITNHGSKNLGDAIDRLTEWMLVHMHEQRETDTALSDMRAELVLHIAEGAISLEKVRTALTSLDERISCVESHQ